MNNNIFVNKKSICELDTTPHRLSKMVIEMHFNLISAIIFSRVFGFTESPIVKASLLEGFFKSERARNVQA